MTTESNRNDQKDVFVSRENKVFRDKSKLHSEVEESLLKVTILIKLLAL